MNRDEANKRIRRTNIRGKQYAEVNQRVLAFWEIYPNGALLTELLFDDGDRCTFKATAMDGDMPLATGHAFEVRSSSNINKTSYIENCETSAVGRALGMLGIGAEDAICSAEEVDAAISQQQKPAQQRYAQPVAKKQTKAAEAATEPCSEYRRMLTVFQEYVDITGSQKAAAWKKFHGADVKPDDADMALAVIADIDKALNE